MDRIKGYTSEEIEELAALTEKARAENGRLSGVFEEFGRRHDRAGGSVRNFYYEFLRMCENSPSLSERYFSARPAVNRAKAFTDEELNTLLSSISDGKRRNKSVRRTIIELSGGDEKLMLRYQNKYRSVLKEEGKNSEKSPKSHISAGSMAKLKREIDELVDRIASDVRAENAALKKRNEELEREIARLSAAKRERQIGGEM